MHGRVCTQYQYTTALLVCVVVLRLGEACSHVAAILSSLATATDVQLKSGINSCTSQTCMWLPPAKNMS